ncbi:hypothetical protein WICPIJ_005388 [Wickerhamomyces pijperi]|uniref:Uncharacterized protein n=1 Tax=Wickerhamomyces pijperi TaxID=599730 RepID=A0A9P8TL62_WICPI|nr:hypothetical protein WICPIJ_005388 [Wickerhamomyces pijperi]
MPYPQLGATYKPTIPSNTNGYYTAQDIPDIQENQITYDEHKDREISAALVHYYESLINGTQYEGFDEYRSLLWDLDRITMESDQDVLRIKTPVGHYLRSHIHWTPQLNTERIIDEFNNPIKTEKKASYQPLPRQPPPSEKPSTDQFTSYIHLSKNVGSKPLPALYYHASCTSNETIFLFGGLTTIYQNYTPESLRDIARFKVNPVALPTPISNNIINSPCVIPNDQFYTISSQTNVTRKFTPRGDVPPPLLCMTASLLTERYVFCYGGFELVKKVSRDGDNFNIVNSVRLNNHAWVFDAQSLAFKKHSLLAHPNPYALTPLTIPRFGHTSNSVNISKYTSISSSSSSNTGTGSSTTTSKNSSKSNEDIATVFITGGYKLKEGTDSCPEFEEIQDLWRVEVLVTYRGKNGFFEFSEQAIATPIAMFGNSKNENEIPKGRAFHVAQIFDAKTNLDNVKNHIFNRAAQNEPRVGMMRPMTTSSTTLTSNSSNTSAATSASNSNIGNTTGLKNKHVTNLKLIIHGGVNNSELLGDVWWFDFDVERWFSLNTFYNQFDPQTFQFQNALFPCQVRKCGHGSFLIDRYLCLIMGAIPTNYTLDERLTKEEPPIKDISDLFIDFKDLQPSSNEGSNQDRHYHRIFILDLSLQTWTLYKCFHKYAPLHSGAQSHVSYTGMIGANAAMANARVYITGGEFITNLRFANLDKREKKREVMANLVQVMDFAGAGLSNLEMIKGIRHGH